LDSKRAGVLGEFGGLGLPVAGHTWLDKGNWGYVKYNSSKEVTDAYVDLLTKMRGLIPLGLCAAIYTQTTDVEIETNGWLTYDRQVFKIDQKRARDAAMKLYSGTDTMKILVQPAGVTGAASKYVVAKPSGNWTSVGFNDSTWTDGVGRYTNEKPKVVHTDWNVANHDIWVRREVIIDSVPAATKLFVFHDDDVEVYINGVLAVSRKNWTTGFIVCDIAPAAMKALKKGKNIIAMHCNSMRGGQHLDVGLIAVK
jgi:hypothetical protein